MYTNQQSAICLLEEDIPDLIGLDGWKESKYTHFKE